MKARLVKYENGELTEQHVLTGTRNTIGRDLGNLVQVSHPKISKTHAVIHTKSGGWQALGGGWQVEDAGSINGVFLFGTLIKGGKTLSYHARLGFGPVEFEFECGTGDGWDDQISIDASPEAFARTMPGVRPVEKPAKKGLMGWLKRG
jgi:pSer/pThr/pTyr-binding forkhead associated (FHA) protein